MDAALIDRVELGAVRSASALLAAAMAYAVFGLLATAGVEPKFAFCAAASAAAFGYLFCCRILDVAGDGPMRFVLPDFSPPAFEFSEAPDELLLTDLLAPSDELLLTDRLDAPRVPVDQTPLVLDDIIAQLGPDARVVRLFDRKAMPMPAPTPGQLQSRIANRLGDGAPLSAPSGTDVPADASQALSAALAELRRSLR